VIIDAGKGYVLTNNHVIDGADDISVTLHDGRTLKAKLIGNDPDTDVAVVQIPADNLAALPLADSGKLRVGDFVVALGNPFGVGQTATSGIVSGLNRSGLHGLGIQNFIQTDASINPGNSGGALVNLRGELVGINSAIYSPSGGNVGIGFAIPAEQAKPVVLQLMKGERIHRGYLGVQIQPLDDDIAQALKLPKDHGEIVARVEPGQPAARAGVQQGDVIVKVNGQDVNSAFNYEYTVRMRDALGKARAAAPKAAPVKQAALEASDLPAGPTLHGHPGGPPTKTEMSQFKIVIPKRGDERKDNPEAGKGGQKIRKG